MCNLWSGQKTAKSGLHNDPIDWFKLRLNQPKKELLKTLIFPETVSEYTLIQICVESGFTRRGTWDYPKNSTEV